MLPQAFAIKQRIWKTRGPGFDIRQRYSLSLLHNYVQAVWKYVLLLSCCVWHLAIFKYVLQNRFQITSIKFISEIILKIQCCTVLKESLSNQRPSWVYGLNFTVQLIVEPQRVIHRRSSILINKNTFYSVVVVICMNSRALPGMYSALWLTHLSAEFNINNEY